MSDSIGSTSWPSRNRAHFRQLDDILRQNGGADPVEILLIGPGAVTRMMRPLLNDADRPGGRTRKLIGDLARYADQLVRRVPGLPLVSLEAVEIQQVLTTPHVLTVLDVSPRVLAAVARDLPHARVLLHDLESGPIPARADVIVAFNVLSRIAEGRRAASHLLAGLSSRGLLLIDDRSAARVLPEGTFEPIAPKIHRRRG